MSSKIKPEELTIEILEHVYGEPTDRWHGHCSEVAQAAAQTVGGTYAYGHYLGDINPAGYWGAYIRAPFVRHAWVLLDGGERILDPTWWSFMNVKPVILITTPGNTYDEGGQQWRAAMMRPPPPDDPKLVPSELLLLDISAEAAAHINALLTRPDNGRISFPQACWLASNPVSTLGDFAREFYELLEENDWDAAIPIDHKRMVMA